ncbi:DMT family transporter [Cereibacter sphaeroides]|uniref:DMT family transporter n=1 Tax=Cereibacter sphaeroides TaxID=1063 RepID=UPI001F40E767|nr:DMT family transporter [Cereibacter sphaeroides]MCE6952933.1 DMT family transporter [Cereibacter sphaeroides]
MTRTSLSPRSSAELLLLGTIWGGSFLANGIALPEAGVAGIVAFRVGGAALFLWIAVRAMGLRVPREPRIWGAFLIMGMLNNVIPFTLITWGQQSIASGLASILNAATAIFGVLVAALVLPDERLTARRMAGVLLGFGGVVTVIGPDALAGFDLRSAGQLALLGAALSYACAGAFGRRTLAGLDPRMAAAGMLTASSLVVLPAALALGGIPRLDLSLPTWGALLYLSGIASAFAYLLFYRILAAAGAGNLSLVTLIIPPVAILLGALVLDERLPPHAFAGFALLGLGLLVLDGRILQIPRELGRRAR